MPQTQKKWKEVSNGFKSWWNFPNCLGPMDGKHAQILGPKNSDNSFFNYKWTFSVVFFKLVDANYHMICTDLGYQGHISDGKVFTHTIRCTTLEKNWLLLISFVTFTWDNKCYTICVRCWWYVCLISQYYETIPWAATKIKCRVDSPGLIKLWIMCLVFLQLDAGFP